MSLEFSINKMQSEYKDEVIKMMTEFYSSDAVSTNGSQEIFESDFEACIDASSNLDGYVFVNGSEVLGYAMTARSFSTEFGRSCIWLEDLYVKPNYRRQGIISKFINFLTSIHPDCVFRLEAEKENLPAIKAYERNGFSYLPYAELIKYPNS